MDTYIMLGANIGCREKYIGEAARLIGERVGKIAAKSPIYETEPWGYSDSEYLNQAIQCSTSLGLQDLIKATSQIEDELGRVRGGSRYQARTIDIDILLYGSMVSSLPEITVPHPRMQERNFVLVPMCFINESLVHPVMKKTMKELLQQCTDKCCVKLYKKQ